MTQKQQNDFEDFINNSEYNYNKFINSQKQHDCAMLNALQQKNSVVQNQNGTIIANDTNYQK